MRIEIGKGGADIEWDSYAITFVVLNDSLVWLEWFYGDGG